VDFRAAVAELDALVETLEREDDRRALLLLDLVDAIHRPALERLAAGDVDHPVARAILAMYDLAPVEPRVLVEEALDSVRPYIESHGGSVELLDVRDDDGAVRVRLGGSCQGCAASSLTLRRGVETAIRERWAGFRELVADAPPAPAAPLLQIDALRRPVFVDVDAGGAELRAVVVDGVPVLLTRVGGEVYAFRNACPVDGRPIDGGRLAEGVLVCPWHNCAYDARTGRRADGEDAPGLAVVPVALDGASVRVAVNVA
jgi:Fe-S cluster biogenesis protein NfuA/nitrite reductase/ring-hydroxylating ferredoxin subunit